MTPFQFMVWCGAVYIAGCMLTAAAWGYRRNRT